MSKRADEVFISRVPSRGGDVRVHLAYPNTYWVAMSNLGFQAVHRIFSEQAGVCVERAFLPEELLHPVTGGYQCLTHESSTPLPSCDILGFSLSFETDYPHLLRMLKASGLFALGASERDKLLAGRKFDAPIIIAGGTAMMLNPEPVAEFLDAIVIGEAEELISELVATIRAGREDGLDREGLLLRLAALEGIYVPRFYSANYSASGSIHSFSSDPRVTSRPQRRYVKDISKYPTYTSILTPETEFSSMFLTETGRGCEMGCRFCVAGYIYRPVRKRSEESVRETVQIGRKYTDAIGFVGAAVSSHRAIAKLSSEVAQSGARASLSSLMAQKVTPELAASLSESEYKTVALAPEAGTERLRRRAGKRVRNEEFIEAAAKLARVGIRGFKLYYIVGLPGEEDSDIDGIAELSIAIRDKVVELSRSSGRLAWVVLSVNPFIPKASTPFQWEPMMPKRILEKKIDRVRELVRRVPNLELHFEPPKESYFQALLSRGDRRVAKLLLLAEERGKDWKWLMKSTFESPIQGVPPIDFYVVRRIPYDEILPWEIIDSRIEKKLLMREALRAHSVEGSSPDVSKEDRIQVLECL